MAKVSIEESTLYAIGDAIREKGGTTAGLNPEGEMPAAIRAIQAGGNGEIKVTPITVKAENQEACRAWDVESRGSKSLTTTGTKINVTTYLMVSNAGAVENGLGLYIQLKNGEKHTCSQDVTDFTGLEYVGNPNSNDTFVIGFGYRTREILADNTFVYHYHSINAEDIDFIYLSAVLD